MILTFRRGKTKATCPCGGQTPLLPDSEWEEWKRSADGRAWMSAHRPHSKTETVTRGGKVESIDEALAKTQKKQPEAIATGDDLPEALR